MSEKALELIAQNIKSKEKKLNLSETGLKTIPEGIKKCVWLEVLNLHNNKELEDLTPIAGLVNLQELQFSYTQVSNLEPIAGLVNLRDIKCERTQVADIEPFAALINIEIIDISYTKITSLAPLQFCKKLWHLWCSELEITNFNILSKFTNLEKLGLGSSNFNDCSHLSELRELNQINLYDTRIQSLEPFRNLLKLEFIQIGNTSVIDLSPISQLPKLKQLYFDHTLVSNLFSVLPLIKKEIDITYRGCPLTNPPIEIVEQGNEAILKYFEEKNKQGEQKLYEAKIVVVGAGESGKTTLIKKLLDPAHPVPNAEDKRTEGIRVVTYPFNGKVKNEEKDLTAYLWDFGGQELYHATHQFFLTPDTLYILLNDNRKNDTDFYYWLNILRLRAGDNCPILTVFNAKDKSPRQIKPGDELFEAFPGVVRQPIDIDFADKNLVLFENLKRDVEGHFTNLEVLGRPYPALWVQAREALGGLNDEKITWTRFQEICTSKGIEDESSMRILAQTLHNLGVLLYFPDVFGLENLVILQPQWCIDAIYKAFDLKTIINGRFTEKILSDCWRNDPRFRDHSLQLLKLMQQFDLCYPVEGSRDEYIAPQLLPLEENRIPDFPGRNAIHVRFEYTFMPAGMVTSLIARMSRHIRVPHVWRTGVTLEWEEGSLAEITEQAFSRQINIKVVGVEAARRLSDIRKTLMDIHQRFRGLKYEEKVACNCADCADKPAATMFEFSELEDNAFHNDDMTCRNGSRKKIPAKQILEGIAFTDNTRIFISYSHQIEPFKDEFRTMIKPMERTGNWKVWDDRWLLPGDDWNREILRHLSEANVIVLMLTAAFFSSDFIYDIELSRAIQRHESGDALLIGVVVSDCMWEQTPLRKIQMVPKDALPVERHPHRSEVWKSVAKSIQEAIAAREMRNKRKDW